ncbi:MAG: hypothetical protein U9P42_04255 [Candidatus Fermentibacteria bacterium]|nr:hypothetical protein [Candidatus Fermentibacteria bacterium]
MGEFRAGLLGWPVSHSLSPVIQSIFLRHFRIKGTYELFPVEYCELSAFFTELGRRRFTGLNVTVPHKMSVMEICDSLSAEAESAGAVNTLVFEPGDVRGYNTDIAGFQIMIRDLPRPFYVLGKGGVAGAISAALKASDVVFVPRGGGISRANRPAEATVVNATPLGWKDDDIFPFPVPSGWSFVDLNYNPRWRWRNSLQSHVITGEKMLVEQAAESFRLWTGHTPGEKLKSIVLERIREKLNENKNNQ